MDWVEYMNWSRSNQCSFEEVCMAMGTECLLLAGALESIDEHASSVVFGKCFRRFYPGSVVCFFVSGRVD